MAQLIISLNNQIIKRAKLTQANYMLGRSMDCDVVLDDRTVSAVHARIINAGEECFLEDLSSTNGIYVNHIPTHKHLLLDKDLIQIGKYEILFESPISLANQLKQLSKHPRLLAELADYSFLEILGGKRHGYLIPLQRQRITLGGEGSGVKPITLEMNPQGECLLHLHDAEKANTSRLLLDQDIIEVGDIELKFYANAKVATL